MLKARESKGGTVEIATVKEKGASGVKIDWKGMLPGTEIAIKLAKSDGDRKRERKLELLSQITVKKWPRGSLRHEKNRHLLDEVNERLELAKGKIAGREDFSLVYPWAYKELCRRPALMKKIWPERKMMMGKYKGRGDEELLAVAVECLTTERISSAREFDKKHYGLYRNLSREGKRKLREMIGPDLGNAGELYIGEDFLALNEAGF